MQVRIPIKVDNELMGWVVMDQALEAIMIDYSLTPDLRLNKLIPRTGEIVTQIEAFRVQRLVDSEREQEPEQEQQEYDMMQPENNLNDDQIQLESLDEGEEDGEEE